MPTTPNYALPYPALSDDPDVPGDLQGLATAVDTALGQTRADLLAELEATRPRTSILTLPDITSPPAEGAFVNWGDTITFANPGRPVVAAAWGTGYALNDGDGTQHRMRIGISTNAGAAYAWGVESFQQGGVGGATRRAGLSPIHLYGPVIPDGDVLLRAQVWWSDGGSAGAPTFLSGGLMAMLFVLG